MFIVSTGIWAVLAGIDAAWACFGWGKNCLDGLGRPLRSEHSPEAKSRGSRAHVIILDGTMSTLDAGFETHAGATYHLCREMGAEVSVFYEAGVQWRSWRRTSDVLLGRGINRQIRRAYGYLASRYRPGDRIYLFGYSRGAYAVRSLAGVIDMVGLVRAEHATTRNIRNGLPPLRMPPRRTTCAGFQTCILPRFSIDRNGRGLGHGQGAGLRLPLLWRWPKTGMHSTITNWA